MAIWIEHERDPVPVSSEWVHALASRICESLGFVDPELSIVLTDDADIQALNAQWRDKDKPTDVLSFSQLEGELPVSRDGTVGLGAVGDGQRFDGLPLGDVVISLETAQRQAQQFGHGIEDELKRLLVHGILHLLGHDHVHGGAPDSHMLEEEKRLLRAVDYAGTDLEEG